jgi:parallel beta-helix repeat protein
MFSNEYITILISSLLFASIFSSEAAPHLNMSGDVVCQRVVDTSGDNWTIAIWDSGKFCVGQNLSQDDPIFKLPHQPVPKSPLLLIRHSEVFADLNGHNLKPRVEHREGIRVFAMESSPLRAISIRNGFISSTSGPTIYMVDAFNDKNRNIRFGRNFPIAVFNGYAAIYRPTEFILENLTLQGDSQVIIMQGMNNIIRHCKIIGGNGTVNVFGPNLIFEDNEIILHAKTESEASGEAPVALYLEDAANSVIRNNHITIKGNTSSSQSIVLKNSPNVTLQGNTVSGNDTLYKLLDERSSVIATDNHPNR